MNERAAGDASTLPHTSTAATAKECAPLANASVVTGDAHPAGAPPSTWHRNVDPTSVEVNAKVAVAVVIVEPWAGPEVIVVSGATESGAAQVLIRMSSMNQP